MNGVQEFDAFRHGTLEGFASADEACAARAFVNDRSSYGFFEVVGTRCSARVDKPSAAHVAIGHLISRQIDWVIAAEIGVDALVKFAIAGIAHVEGLIATVIFGQLLLDDVGLDGNAEVVSLTGKVSGHVIVLVFFEGIIAKVAPQNSGHAEFMCFCEGVADLDDLAAALFGAEINGGAHGGSAHVIRFLDRAEENLIGLVGEGK